MNYWCSACSRVNKVNTRHDSLEECKAPKKVANAIFAIEQGDYDLYLTDYPKWWDRHFPLSDTYPVRGKKGWWWASRGRRGEERINKKPTKGTWHWKLEE